MDTGLSGKVAIVTGGARGIGREYCLALAAEGASVVIADVLETEGKETANDVRMTGGKAMFVYVDVADQDSALAMAKVAVDEYGGIDVLVNNAAMFASLRGMASTDLPVDRWDRTMAVNVKGPWLCSGAVIPSMRARGGGSIVNQSSIAALGLGGMLDYSVSKAALIGMTKNLAIELGTSNIRVNAIAPGGVATQANAEITNDPEFTAMAERVKVTQLLKRPIQPADMVGALLFLAGNASKFMTGQTLVVDGGRFFLG